jgi:ATP-dependent DNA ligase
VGAGAELFQELEKLKIEGMVAKRLDSFYIGGRTRDWVKIKTSAGREEMRKRSEAWQR